MTTDSRKQNPEPREKKKREPIAPITVYNHEKMNMNKETRSYIVCTPSSPRAHSFVVILPTLLALEMDMTKLEQWLQEFTASAAAPSAASTA